MLPDTRDIAALPTSWALTLWDALPVILSVELTVVIATAVLLSPARLHRLQQFAAALPTGAVAYLLLFDSKLFIAVAAAAGFQVMAARRLMIYIGGVNLPEAPGPALVEFAGQVAWAVMKGAAVAALIKVMLAPGIDSGSSYWLITGTLGGALTPVPLGISAIPALAVQSASGSLLPGILWIVAAAVRPFVLDWLKALRSPGPSDARSTSASTRPS